MYDFHHIHLKTTNASEAADWFAKALNFNVLDQRSRPVGGTLVRSETACGSLGVFFSDLSAGETLAKGTVGPQFGIEHLAFASQDVAKDVEKLTKLGARVHDGPNKGASGQWTVFLISPHDIMLELIQPAP